MGVSLDRRDDTLRSLTRWSLMRGAVKALCALALSLLSCVWTQQGASAMRLGVSAFQARHLSEAQRAQQLKRFERALERLGGLDVMSAKSLEGYVLSAGEPLSALEKLHTLPRLKGLLCQRAQLDALTLVEMRLGTQRKPARLIVRVIDCQSDLQEAASISFSGRLSQALWRDLSRQLDELLTSLGRQKSARRAAPSSLMGDTPPPMSDPPPPMSNTTPSMGAQQVEMSEAQGAKATKTEQKLWWPRLSLWLEGRAMSRSFSYTALPESLSLKGGINYSAQWLPGVGVHARLGLSPRLALEGEYAEYTFTSTQVIFNLFDDDDYLNLESSQRLAALGVVISHPFVSQGGLKTHWVSVRVGWLMNEHLIERNNDYQGFTAHCADLLVSGTLSLSERRVWLELKGRLQPLVSLGSSVQELGAEAETLGFGFELGVVMRGESGLSLKPSLSFDQLSHAPIGEGRGGRLALEASDQLIQAKLAVGWVTP